MAISSLLISHSSILRWKLQTVEGQTSEDFLGTAQPQLIVQKRLEKGAKNESTARCLKITEKVSIQHCERSELRLHFEWTQVN